jgi:hypothetical protein
LVTAATRRPLLWRGVASSSRSHRSSERQVFLPFGQEGFSLLASS